MAFCRKCYDDLTDVNWFKSYQKRGSRICKKCLEAIKKKYRVKRERKPAVPRIYKHVQRPKNGKEIIGYQVRHGQKHISIRGTMAGALIKLEEYKSIIK